MRIVSKKEDISITKNNMTKEEIDILAFLNLPVKERNRIRLQRLIEKVGYAPF